MSQLICRQKVAGRGPRIKVSLMLVLLFLLSVPGLRADFGDPASADLPPAPPPAMETVKVTTWQGIPYDVWFDGVRHGITPLETELRPGSYRMSAIGVDSAPVIRDITVRRDQVTRTVLLDRPLDVENYDSSARRVIAAQREDPQNAHYLIMAAMLTRMPEDFDRLMGMLDEETKRNPLLLIARARRAEHAGDAEGALEMVEQSIRRVPDFSAAWREKSRLLLEAGRPQQALDAAEEAVLYGALEPASFESRAVAFEALGDQASARMDRRHAGELMERRRTRGKEAFDQVRQSAAERTAP